MFDMCLSRSWSMITRAAALAPLLAFTGRAAAAAVAADDAHISYEGRYVVAAGHVVRMGFPGITLRLKATATAVQMKVHATSDDVYFKVAVDGAPAQRIRVHQGSSIVTLLADGTTRTHVIEVVRISESWQGQCEILGFETDGDLLPPPPLPSRKLLFIGDSVTCGEGVIPNGPGKTMAERTDATESFAMKLAARFHAQCHLVSYGGRGVIRDWQGIRATNNAPQFYELALPDDPNVRWNPAQYVPDAIGVCLGTNDFSQGIPDENEFVNGFVEFLRKVQRDAPDAAIFLIDSPILGDAEIPKRTACAAFLDEVVRRLNSPLVRHARIRQYQGSAGDAHPVAVEQTAIADELEPAFRAALHW